jgi:hypothetical protein
MGADQRQQRTEIPPLPDGKSRHTICQSLRERDNNVPVAIRQPALQAVPPLIIDLHGAG